MATKTLRSKLTIRVWDRLFKLLVERTDAICQRRDALLERVIAHEIDHLREDLPQPNSPAARAHIEHHLRLLLAESSKQVSVALSPKTAEQLEAVCAEKNVPREAFLNRLILLLVAKPKFIDQALFGLDSETAHAMRMEIKDEFHLNLELENGFAPLPMIADILVDPFWGYREMTAKLSAEADQKDTLYALPFLQDTLLGLNCYIADHLVPGTPAYLEAQKRTDKLLAELGGQLP